MGSDKERFKNLHEDKYIEARDVARTGGAGVPTWSQAWVGTRRRAPGGWVAPRGGPAGPDPNERRKGHPPVGPPPAGGTMRDRCKEDWVADEGGDLSGPIPGCLGWL
ncbi:hypothetical protein CRENBAI_008570 [Crenichthys baileyi]|uniref:Uncharacterized protein n=1 Tax=Crenichthys baileyi TaxID=28760 RepID=A0AAV9QTQ2_9TELE